MPLSFHPFQLERIAAKILEWERENPGVTDWGGPLGTLEKSNPDLYKLLWDFDRAGDGVLFGNANQTISRSVAQRAQAGDKLAQSLCGALNFLSPDHCGKVLQSP